MTRWAHDAAARVARPVKRRAAVLALDAGNAAALRAEEAVTLDIFHTVFPHLRRPWLIRRLRFNVKRRSFWVIEMSERGN
jgi:hypothetical protein